MSNMKSNILNLIMNEMKINGHMLHVRVRQLHGKDTKEDGEKKDLLQVPGMPTRFSHEILVVATENFSWELGKGGFGSVFEGILTDGTKVAVKCINGLSQTKDSFLAEVETIGRIHHLNLIFHRNKELALDWQTRRNIILDIAKGHPISMKNLMDRNQSQVVTTLRGTPGYLAPEWLSSRKAKEDQMLDLVDKCSEDMQLHGAEAVEMLRLDAWCLQNYTGRRPSMSMVIKVLEGLIDVEDNLDYNFFNSSELEATEAVHRGEINVGFASPKLPSILSGPR
ncbi:G-type lectin S-receptor-like serine/threonine-protein kinase SD2-5 [Vitis vinifera]|uniref:G-type lectin S-receptor-like serine/threonine-protein kinase SD2-5 n=1 Tax=Vitis vinifera TaxID=29760 RepID=A0A438HZ22_VITVI|nr:G-type lectin S-receptor-like serine/threonine-protein kinase SD2-5 [Vitis vinifera]